jgi:hypothetical protein
MKYLVRLNLKAYNPLTRKWAPNLLWEIEQCEKIGGNGRQDSEPIIWHCEDVRIDQTPIRKLFKLAGDGEKPWQLEVWGICVRGQDNAIEIHTGPQDVSGN